MKSTINRSTAIIVTLPVRFLLDLADDVLQKRYVHPCSQSTGRYVEQWYRKSVFSKSNAIYPDMMRNTKRAKTELGLIECIRQIESVNTFNRKYPDSETPMMWHHSIGNIPNKENMKNITHVYFNILSKIRFRGKLIEYKSAGQGKEITYQFSDKRKWTGKHWLFIMDFERLNPEIKMGGFQGFRYWKDDRAEWSE